MALSFFKPKSDPKNPTKKNEILLDQVGFKVYKLNNRPKPTKTDRIKIISCFSEFGCEVLGSLYCIPRLLKRYPGQYIIVIGWYGRDYLYRHLVDEYWEIDESHMWLRDYARAFHHVSRNLKKIEEAASKYGQVVPSAALGKYAVSNYCRTCGKFWHEWRKRAAHCPLCKSTVLVRSIFSDIYSNKDNVRRIPTPRREYLEWAKGFVKPNSVGIFARSRKTYGRNLEPDFYVKLIKLLEDKGHSVIWLGEKQSTLPCPVDHVIDFSRMTESRELERTLAIVSQLNFTVQFWTASTRLAGVMGVPFLLFESPEQIYASFSGIMAAQEGKRLELCSFGPKKIVLAHYNSVMENQEVALNLVDQAIGEMKKGDWSDLVGLVEDREFLKQIQTEYYQMLE